MTAGECNIMHKLSVFAGNVKDNIDYFNVRNPVAIIGATITIIESALILYTLFGGSLTPEQQAGIITLVIAIGELIKILWSRSKVTPMKAPRTTSGEPANILAKDLPKGVVK